MSKGASAEPTGLPPLGFAEDDDEYDLGLDEDEFFDCHMGPDGYCGAAGSEWCEFECPYRRGAA